METVLRLALGTLLLAHGRHQTDRAMSEHDRVTLFVRECGVPCGMGGDVETVRRRAHVRLAWGGFTAFLGSACVVLTLAILWQDVQT